MIKAVLFDVDGVLIDSFEANLKFFQDLMEYVGYPAPTEEEYRAIFHLNMKAAIETMTGSDSPEEVEKIWLAGKNRLVDYPSHLVRGPERLKEVIEEIGQKYRLGIVTSRVKERVFVYKGLEALKDNFKVVVSFEDTEVHKPHPEPILLACGRLSLPPEECIYIGDSKSDVEAAHSAGMKAIVYSDVEHDGADSYTTDFNRLPELVDELNYEEQS